MPRWNNIPQLKYQNKDLNFILESNSETKLDNCLRTRWENAQSLGVFRYTLNIKDCKVLPGKFSFLAQANEERASLRRKPQCIQQTNSPFDPTLFNFTLLKEEEVLFTVINDDEVNSSDNFVAINASPLEYGNCLLLPALEECHPQVVTESGLKFAMTFLLLSGSLDLRIGFNGLCAFASVNHQHYHSYYLRKRMLLENVDVHHLAGPCYELTDYPAEGFVFQLLSDDTNSIVRDVCKLTSYLQTSGIAHNLYLTRGSKFEDCKGVNKSSSNQFTIRIYVWARKPSHGSKEVEAFNPALCELFGHLPIKSMASYQNITEDYVADVLYDICHEVFVSLREKVSQLFKQE